MDGAAKKSHHHRPASSSFSTTPPISEMWHHPLRHLPVSPDKTFVFSFLASDAPPTFLSSVLSLHIQRGLLNESGNEQINMDDSHF
jgi:hypothetical protein